MSTRNSSPGAHWLGLAFSLVTTLGIVGAGPAAEPVASVFNEDMQGYKATKAVGLVEALQGRLDRGETKLVHEPRHGYLLSLLHELKVPPSSQVLVASKTSPNKALISPHNPRALYYNDDISVAYVPAADVLEVTAADPKLGVVFYTLEQAKLDKPRLLRDDRCLECHASSKTLDVPGLLTRSFQTDKSGDVSLLSGVMVTHRTPLAERWGGYYVTGTHGSQLHRGNLFGDLLANRDPKSNANGNITDLKRFLDVAKYPEPGSDLVALMVLEHQAHMQTLLTRLNADVVQAIGGSGDLRGADASFDATLKYLLFADEARLTAPVKGTSEFAEWFAKQGPKGKSGRSLREFDLQTRLFKYPCSYMIYSPSFDSLPATARKYFYRKLRQVLDGDNRAGAFGNLSVEQRRAIREILLETKSDLPVDWQL